jgi:hypothetical protein
MGLEYTLFYGENSSLSTVGSKICEYLSSKQDSSAFDAELCAINVSRAAQNSWNTSQKYIQRYAMTPRHSSKGDLNRLLIFEVCHYKTRLNSYVSPEFDWPNNLPIGRDHDKDGMREIWSFT